MASRLELLALAALPLLALLAQPGHADPPGRSEEGARRPSARTDRAAPRLEHFALSRPLSPWGSEPVGEARVVRREEQGAVVLELDLSLTGAGLRLSWSDREATGPSPAAGGVTPPRRSVYREWHPASEPGRGPSGRVLVVERGADGGPVEWREWAAGGLHHRREPAPEGGLDLPRLVESLRSGGGLRAVTWLDAIEGTWRRALVLPRRLAPGVLAVDVVATDGGGGSRWVFVDGQLEAFSLGELRGRRIPAEAAHAFGPTDPREGPPPAPEVVVGAPGSRSGSDV